MKIEYSKLKRSFLSIAFWLKSEGAPETRRNLIFMDLQVQRSKSIEKEKIGVVLKSICTVYESQNAFLKLFLDDLLPKWKFLIQIHACFFSESLFKTKSKFQF